MPQRRLHAIAGVSWGWAAAGIKGVRRPDLALLTFDRLTTVAGVFTQNRFPAAPVEICREHLDASRSRVRALLINSGNANCGNGARGLRVARHSCRHVAQLLGCEPHQVLPFSTGVIAEPLDLDALKRGSDKAATRSSGSNWHQAARAIMTTDTKPKAASARFKSGRKLVTITGIAKGSGMIHPDMATMLAFIACDARVPPGALRRELAAACDVSFNAISVDGDTSTNDSVILAATGRERLAGARGQANFTAALRDICAQLAEQIVRDGEGATRLARVSVTGFGSAAACRLIAESVACSPLVKTMLHASDPNIGRLLMAAGKAGVPFDPERVTIRVNGVTAFAGGRRSTGYTEKVGQRAMRREPVEFAISYGRGRGAASMLFTDLSKQYVKINAEYRS